MLFSLKALQAIRLAHHTRFHVECFLFAVEDSIDVGSF